MSVLFLSGTVDLPQNGDAIPQIVDAIGLQRPQESRAVSGITLFAEATLLLEAGLCIWCESAPASEGSHLCRSCRVDDPDGVLAAQAPVASPAT
jgi:hypothetical protein